MSSPETLEKCENSTIPVMPSSKQIWRKESIFTAAAKQCTDPVGNLERPSPQSKDDLGSAITSNDLRTPNRLIFRINGEFSFIAVEDIVRIDADGNYVNVRTIRLTFTLRHTMAGLCALLGPQELLRVHRSTLVNPRYVTAVKTSMGKTAIVLSDSTVVAVGGHYRQQVYTTLGLTNALRATSSIRPLVEHED